MEAAASTENTVPAEAETAAEPEPEEEKPAVVTREGLSQLEMVPFTLVTLRLRRDESGLVARVNEGAFFRTEDCWVEDVLDLPTKASIVDDVLYVHFGDKFEELPAWTPAPGEEPSWQIAEAACAHVNGLLQGRWPSGSVSEEQLWRRKDMTFLRLRMMENLSASLGELAKATVGKRSALIATAVQLEVRSTIALMSAFVCSSIVAHFPPPPLTQASERAGTRGKLMLEEGHSNDETPYGKARYRTAGNAVQLFGAISRVWKAEPTLALVLPEELWPAQAQELQAFLDPEDDTAEAVLTISPQGEGRLLSLARYSVFSPAPERETILLAGLSYNLK